MTEITLSNGKHVVVTADVYTVERLLKYGSEVFTEFRLNNLNSIIFINKGEVAYFTEIKQ